MTQTKFKILKTLADQNNTSHLENIGDIISESKILARRAAKRWASNETGGGIVPIVNFNRSIFKLFRFFQ